jgi:hypothetical protein
MSDGVPLASLSLRISGLRGREKDDVKGGNNHREQLPYVVDSRREEMDE